MPKKHEPIKDAIPKWYEPKKMREKTMSAPTLAWEKKNGCTCTCQKERIAHALKDCKKREGWHLSSNKNIWSSHLHNLNQSVWLVSARGPVFDLATWHDVNMPATPLAKDPQKALLDGRENKTGNLQRPLVRTHTLWVIESIIWGTYFYLKNP